LDADPPHLPSPKLERLRKRWQFLAVAKGRSHARGAVMIQVAPRVAIEGCPPPDPTLIGVGFTATKRVGGAVVRNRAKRRLREAARALVPLHGLPGHDYVVVARASVTTRSWERLLDDVKSALISLAAPS
jgi:ribonuclease P protein component